MRLVALAWLSFSSVLVICQMAAFGSDASVRNDYPFTDARSWLPAVKSLRIRAETRYESTAAGLERSRREIQQQFPDLKDPDPLDFTGLLPVVDVIVDHAFDQSRMRAFEQRQTADKIKLSRDLRIWNGKQTIIHEQHFRNQKNFYLLSPEPERVVSSQFQYFTYLRSQSPLFWWNSNRQAIEQFEQYQGKPTDYILVGREMFHGVECDVFLSAVGNQSDRYYVGVQDGRWHGAKEGIIAFVDLEAFSKNYQSTVEEFSGEKVQASILAQKHALQFVHHAFRVMASVNMFDGVKNPSPNPCRDLIFVLFRN